jgi:hypothetical protein
MSSSQDIQAISEPLATVLRDYLHVEWYELAELAAAVKDSTWRVDHVAFKAQLHQAIASATASMEAVKSLTGQEFDDPEQLRDWLSSIWIELYGAPPSGGA